MEVLICEATIGATRLRLLENHGTVLPFSICESFVGEQTIACRDDFATIDAATQAYLDRRRELRLDRGL